MYLTRLTLDPRNASARRDLASAYDMHRTLTRAYVAGAGASPLRFLWRLEANGNAWVSPQVLIQAEELGNWEPIIELGNYLQRDIETKEVAIEKFVQSRRLYRFRLTANPTVTRNGKRYGLSSREDQLSWLDRQGTRHGFRLKNAIVSADDQLTIRREGRAPIMLRAVRFDGELEVADPVALGASLTAGIGPGKAFGCGLLSLAPLRTSN